MSPMGKLKYEVKSCGKFILFLLFQLCMLGFLTLFYRENDLTLKKLIDVTQSSFALTKINYFP